ncbi:MAG: tRNA lysidine(34) synthetase TilS [Bdellovibrionales bacterium RIFOXYD12_FULL_39_22]|nr:MAG: tRNA lysidine(34) synthetase TilS [Bdellovibrionales bacterium RIFOXYB1_FULL_39_21]OFZ41063.1 MAG: tRNA lysidine(34) synthetase TilS [Bdellovibrionales bacterium RIFOXYC12_FULL_39_17]OFZ50276.1 MAG: tRNA lysidine(34) synthetase TilS [Bdellovibrionales bacterium RIFOXYC1_FULL_39_130]OFZ75077.1 MAG: tRNA lysidine(34) synthetase TilS [Bdellovibrionales bacterium RIFOXYD1_FULL_39_84]OFZ92281.1 MAG: tRNA lysidine(34) synthetase TilS [Bdellovibrionales bacterium RIFOXYD12_FULL_39_22]HLE10916
MQKKLMINHVFAFMQQARLFPASRRAFVAVSGGVDSMVLLHILKSISEIAPDRLKELTVLHINHGTRSSNLQEEKFVIKMASQLNLKTKVARLNFSLNQPNFESSARDERYLHLMRYLAPDDLLYTAHHIDDSFEWSLLSLLKSSSPESSIGIPVLNRRVARPLMSLSKNQIKSYARECKILFLDDPSNKDERFERNFLRPIIAKLASRFPQYLKHYVNRANQLALNANCSRMVEANSSPPQLFVLSGAEDWSALIDLSSNGNFLFATEQILASLQHLSVARRGVWSIPIQKLISAAKANKWGPHLLSGSISVFSFFSVLVFCKSSAEAKLFGQMEQGLLLELKRIKDADIPTLSYLQSKKNTEKVHRFHQLPLFAISTDQEIEKMLPTLRRQFRYFKLAFAYAQENGIWIQLFSRLLFVWQKEKNQSRQFKVVPCNLLGP